MVAAHGTRRKRCGACGLLPRKGGGKFHEDIREARAAQLAKPWEHDQELWREVDPDRRWAIWNRKYANMPGAPPNPYARPTDVSESTHAGARLPESPHELQTRVRNELGRPATGRPRDFGMSDVAAPHASTGARFWSPSAGGGVCTMGCKTRKHRKGCGFWGDVGSVISKVATIDNLRKVADVVGRLAPVGEALVGDKHKGKFRKVGEVANAVKDATKGLGVGVRAKRTRGGSADPKSLGFWQLKNDDEAKMNDPRNQHVMDGGLRKVNGKWYRNTYFGLQPVDPPAKTRTGAGTKRTRQRRQLVAGLTQKGTRRPIVKRRRRTGGGLAFESEFDRVDPIDRALWNRQRRAGVSSGHGMMSNTGFW